MKQKVKLIASDLDGTLLQNYMPDCSEEAIELITALTKKGVIFVPASGRQYFSEKALRVDRTAAKRNLSLRDPPQAENPAEQDSIFPLFSNRQKWCIMNKK